MNTSLQDTAVPTLFQFHSNEVRTINRDDQIWFVASDIAKVLGYRDAEKMTRWLDEDESGTHIVGTLGGNQTVTIISESGLYHAILKSRKPEAKPFRRWVTEEVLPAIRKSGSYAAAPGQSIPLAGSSILLTFGTDGHCKGKLVKDGALVVTPEEIAEIVEASGYILAKPVCEGFTLRNPRDPRAKDRERLRRWRAKQKAEVS